MSANLSVSRSIFFGCLKIAWSCALKTPVRLQASGHDMHGPSTREPHVRLRPHVHYTQLLLGLVRLQAGIGGRRGGEEAPCGGHQGRRVLWHPVGLQRLLLRPLAVRLGGEHRAQAVLGKGLQPLHVVEAMEPLPRPRGVDLGQDAKRHTSAVASLRHHGARRDLFASCFFGPSRP